MMGTAMFLVLGGPDHLAEKTNTMTRMQWITLCVCLAMFGKGATAMLGDDAAKGKCLVYIGTYTGEKSKGVYACELDLASGKAGEPKLVAEVKSPSFLAVHPNKKFLYSVNEIDDFNGKPTGGVSAFGIDRASGKLSLLNQQPSGGGGPCHLVVDHSGRSVLVANYGGGSVAALPIGADGKLAPAATVIQHQGHSVDKSRQEGTARAFDQRRSSQQVRRGGRPGTRQAVGLQVRRRDQQAHAQRSAGGPAQARLRAAALRVSPQRQVRLLHQRNGLHGHGLQL